MAIPRLTDDLAFISKLGNDPRSDNGLTTQAFKEVFDKGSLVIQKYLNEVLAAAVDAVNLGAVSVGSARPTISPVLWFDTSGSGGTIGSQLSVRVVYLDAYGNEVVLNPVTSGGSLRFFDTVVGKGAFVLGGTEPDYPYRAAVPLAGARASMVPVVTLRVPDAVGGNFAPAAESYDGGIYLYAASPPEADVVIPTILLFRGNVL